MAPHKIEDYRYTCWDTRAPQDSPARRVQGLTYAELKQKTGFPDSLRERLDADVWPPALEWAAERCTRRKRHLLQTAETSIQCVGTSALGACQAGSAGV
jgi:hypothetical protein